MARLAGDGRLTRARDQHAPAGPGVIITYRSHAQEAAAVVAAAAELGATAAALRLDTAEVAAFGEFAQDVRRVLKENWDRDTFDFLVNNAGAAAMGLPRDPRRRTAGLRREEAAVLCGMSADYYGRLEQRRGPQPSEPMLAAIARGLRLSLDERDHLFRVAGHNTPSRTLRTDHVSPGIMRILDRLADTPAQVLTSLGETLIQTRPAVALVGDEISYTGLARSAYYRWFTDPRSRRIYPAADHPMHGRTFTPDLRDAYSRHGASSRAGAIVAELLDRSRDGPVGRARDRPAP